MKIKYTFVNGEETSVEVYDDFKEIILELNKNLYNNNQTETRRHVSLSAFEEGNKEIKDASINLEEQILTQTDKETLYRALSKLNSDEQSLIYNLYLSGKHMTQKQYADILGVSENAVRKRVAKLRIKLKTMI